LSQTIFVAEKTADLDDLGWMSGTRATLRNTGLAPNQSAGNSTATGAEAGGEANAAAAPPLEFVGGFASAHPGGLLVGFGDASVRFVAETIDLEVWHQLGNRADGKLLKFNSSE
jgi:hypothetical protein